MLGVGDVFGNGVGNFRFNFFSIVRLPGLCLRRGISKIVRHKKCYEWSGTTIDFSTPKLKNFYH